MFVNLYSEVAALLGLICLVANFVSMFTPTRSDNMIIDFFLRIINILACNVCKNENKDDCALCDLPNTRRK